MKLSNFILCLLLSCFSLQTFGQVKTDFTRQDSLRGSLNPMRDAYDVKFYELSLRVDPEKKTIKGHNDIFFSVVEDFKVMQLDLFENLTIDSVLLDGIPVDYKREGNAFFVEFPQTLSKEDYRKVSVYYGGKPIEAVRPPWDGGFTWEKDKKGNDWIAVSCEGIGASLWWPNKDHPSDEPEGMKISFEVPDPLMAVSNGNLTGTEQLDDGYTRYDWFVSYPINNYNVTLNAAVYEHFSDTYTSQDGESLPLDYYVLAYNLEKAKEQFKQVPPMLRCFEQLYGKYPFWDDGYALVETPYWGMEHQSAVAYGNNYQNNEYGFDFIIIHESGHEYWGNSISESDHAEMWIHESFTTYTDALFTECRFGEEAFVAYMADMKEKIKNTHPILAPMGVNYNYWPDADMYYKGAWMLHSIRNTFPNDEAWFEALKKTYQHFKISNVTSEELIQYLNQQTDHDLKPIFDQYLKGIKPPVLVYKLKEKRHKLVLSYKWETDYAQDFNMPVEFEWNGERKRIQPNMKWQKISLQDAKADQLQFDHTRYYFDENGKD